jgi:hypothetical protein
MSAPVLTVNTPDDWAELRRRGLLTVVDPMVYRAGEMFLRGRKAAGSDADARAVWGALSQNIDGLMLFFDELMLHDQLPIFDYSVTYDDPPGLATPELVALVNERGEILVEVAVAYDASDAARRPAIAQLVALQPVDDALADAVVSELSAFDDRWRPTLHELGELSERARAIATFRYGALLFGQYAAALSDEWAPLDQQPEHVLQPKRSRLLLATALAPDGELGTEEARLFDRLRTVESRPQSGIRGAEVPRAPTFLPYLLSKQPDSPRALLRLALKMRTSDEVVAYRRLLADVRGELALGQISKETRDELGALTALIGRRLAPRQRADMTLRYSIPVSPGAVVGAALTGDVSALLPALTIEGEMSLDGVRDALALGNPRKRYRKLLTRLVAAEASYHAIDRHLKTLWAAA